MDPFQDSVTLALDALTSALRPYVRDCLQEVFGNDWLEVARGSFRNDRTYSELSEDVDAWDAHALLSVMWDQWNAVFRRHLSLFERSLVAELRAFRNRWAHQRAFSFDDTYRLLDSVQRLLSRIDSDKVARLGEIKFDLLRDEFGEAINAQAREHENRRERWVTAFVYFMCGSVFVYLIPTAFESILGELRWALTTAVAMCFAYLIYKRVQQRPIQVGPHECRRCRRIIYGTNCPYCNRGSTFDSEEFGSHEEESAVRSFARPTQPR
ncbi:hypothetical protein GC176_00160 [bacterium]|nr:hypothetical protein [bacterium]